MKKNLLIKIIISVLLVGILVGSYLWINQRNKTNESGSLTIILIDENKQIISEKIHHFNKDDTLVTILENNYDCLIEQGMIKKLDTLVTPDTSKYFIKIYQNDTMSMRGVYTMTINDKDVIKFVYTEVGNYE